MNASSYLRGQLHAPIDAPDFDRLARLYRWMEFATFGPYLSFCRNAFLGSFTNARHTLVLGDGDGRFTARLLETNPTVVVDAVDASSAMLQQLLSRAGKNRARVQTHRADLRTWQPAGNFDLVATHFFLDCLTTEQVAELVDRTNQHLSAGGFWVVSDFAVPENLWGSLVAGPIVRILYGCFRLLTGLRVRRLPAHDEAFIQAGLERIESRKWLMGMVFSELWRKKSSVGTPA